jgi:DNA-binding transcriptional ArsR family regulator
MVHAPPLPPPALELLADPTRLRILELLRDRPRPVGELAAELPVSRPAVSKHLRLLKDAALVLDRAEGTRRIYQLRPDGLEQVAAYWGGFWSEALEQFKQFAESGGEGTQP